MRTLSTAQLMMALVAGPLLVVTQSACSEGGDPKAPSAGDDDDDDDHGTVTDATSGPPQGLPTGTPGGTTFSTPPSPPGTTGASGPTVTEAHDDLVVAVTAEGSAVVEPGDRYTGTEVVRFVQVVSGDELCAWAFDALDWEQVEGGVPSPTDGHPCTDPDGNACAFGFSVRLVDGEEAGVGPYCANLGFAAFTADDLGHVGYGYIDDYRYAGTSYGPALMYFIDFARFYPSLPTDTYVYWVGLTAPADFDGTSFEYTLDRGYVDFY